MPSPVATMRAPTVAPTVIVSDVSVAATVIVTPQSRFVPQLSDAEEQPVMSLHLSLGLSVDEAEYMTGVEPLELRLLQG